MLSESNRWGKLSFMNNATANIDIDYVIDKAE